MRESVASQNMVKYEERNSSSELGVNSGDDGTLSCNFKDIDETV